MKQQWYSEKTKQYYDSQKDCIKAEKEFDDKQKTEEETKSAVKADKKLMADKISKADDKLKEANENFKLAQNKANDIIKEAKERAKEIIVKAQQEVKEAEQEKLDAVIAFNNKYGTYTVSLTGEEALKEFNNTMDKFNRLFNPFDIFNILF